jgi:hypothetical protein
MPNSVRYSEGYCISNMQSRGYEKGQSPNLGGGAQTRQPKKKLLRKVTQDNVFDQILYNDVHKGFPMDTKIMYSPS